MVSTLFHWFTRSISRRLIGGLLVALTLSSLTLGALVVRLGKHSLQQEQALAATRLVTTFEASLHNAMLQRDLPGLQRIIDSLGDSVGIQTVQLLNPRSEVRFSSDPHMVGQYRPELCGATPCSEVASQNAMWREHPDGSALVVSHRIVNQSQCTQCHGSQAENPVNGVLVIDFKPIDAGLGSESVQTLIGIGLVALAVFGVLMAWTLRNEVARPLLEIARVTGHIAKGDFTQRLRVIRNDEIGMVSGQFNAMSEKLDTLVGKLTRQQVFLQELLDAMPDPVLVIGSDWRIRLANQAYCDLLGHTQSHVLTQCCHLMSKGLHEPCPATLVNCPVLQSRSAGGGMRTLMNLRHRNGREVPVEIDSTSLELDGERLTVEVLRPLEKTIRFSQEQHLSTIGLLANGVAHEIHNPLASIRLALQASLRGIRKGNMESDELVGYLELVDAQIDRCVLTTQRLMQMSAPPEDELISVGIQQAVEDVVALVSEDAKTHQVQIDTAITPADLRVMGDEAELRQVFVNLIQNAMNAMPGGGQIHIRAYPSAPGTVQIRVSDNGPGISADNLSRIFLPFFSRRVDGSRGMGLGLAITKSIMERFGGTIEAGNQAESGAMLTLTFREAPSDALTPYTRGVSA